MIDPKVLRRKRKKKKRKGLLSSEGSATVA